MKSEFALSLTVQNVAKMDTRRKNAVKNSLRKGMASLVAIERVSNVVNLDIERLTVLELDILKK